MMLDQRAVQALEAVIQTQSFAAAAAQLFVTQPAISQRIKQLETYFGQPLLIRTVPYHATALGEKLLSLLRRTRLLEEHFLQEMEERPIRLSVALNRDSLETWFLRLLTEVTVLTQCDMDLFTDDQEITIDYFRKGLVSACISTYNTPLTGCECTLLGTMEYQMVATPSFIARYFPPGCDLLTSLSTAPLLVFDGRDKLHESYFQRFFKIPFTPHRSHMVPSVQGFKQFVLHGYGFGLIPSLDIARELDRGTLQEIWPGKRWLMDLYWHYWQLSAVYYQQFITTVQTGAKEFLA